MDNQKKIKHFQDLIVWREAHKLVLMVYKITEKFPKSELFGITSQIRRAVSSVTANIAEGFGRFSFKGKVRFYVQSRGSVSELEDHFLTAKDLKYVTSDGFNNVWNQSEKVATIMNGFINSTKRFIK